MCVELLIFINISKEVIHVFFSWDAHLKVTSLEIFGAHLPKKISNIDSNQNRKFSDKCKQLHYYHSCSFFSRSFTLLFVTFVASIKPFFTFTCDTIKFPHPGKYFVDLNLKHVKFNLL